MARSRWLSTPPVNPFAENKRRMQRMNRRLQTSMRHSISTLQKNVPAPPPFPVRFPPM